MKINASKLDRQITIQRATETRDTFHNLVQGPWNNLITVRAAKQEISDGEKVRAQKVRAQEMGADITMRFQVRWNRTIATVNAKDRLLFEGKLFEILGVKEIGRREGREITATTRID